MFTNILQQDYFIRRNTEAIKGEVHGKLRAISVYKLDESIKPLFDITTRSTLYVPVKVPMIAPPKKYIHDSEGNPVS